LTAREELKGMNTDRGKFEGSVHGIMDLHSKIWVLGVVSVLLLGVGCAKKPKVATTIPAEEIPETTTEQPSPPPPPENPAPTPQFRDVEDVFFDFDRSELRTDTRSILDQNAKLLKSNSDWDFVLEGHCDERGTVEYNLALGERRAQSVRSYLVNLGISASRIRTISYGEERPFDPGHNETAWAKNRRVHFVQQ
jgi:peptidoglycan-associated lipoprotein